MNYRVAPGSGELSLAPPTDTFITVPFHRTDQGWKFGN